MDENKTLDVKLLIEEYQLKLNKVIEENILLRAQIKQLLRDNKEQEVLIWLMEKYPKTMN